MAYMKYLNNLKFWRTESKIEESLGSGLTQEQKKKYRKQYLNLAYNTFIISFVYILAVIALINKLFTDNEIWVIAVIVVILRDYVNITEMWGFEVDLIYQRIEKRISKNIKQMNNSFNKNLKENDIKIRGEN